MARSKTILLGELELDGTDVGTYKDIQRTHDDVGAIQIHLSGTPGDLAGTLIVSGRLGDEGREVALSSTDLTGIGGAEGLLLDFPLMPQMRITTISGAGTPTVTVSVYLME